MKKKIVKLKLKKHPTMTNGQPFPSTDRKKVLLRAMLDLMYMEACDVIDEEENEGVDISQRIGAIPLILDTMVGLEEIGTESFTNSEDIIIKFGSHLKEIQNHG